MPKQSPVPVPIYDPSPEVSALWEDIQGAIARVLKSGHFILGPEVEAFEREIGEYLGVSHAVAVNSGTDALLIALRSAGVGSGDEVIVPAFTFVATASSVALAGATPVFVDIDPVTLNISAEAVGKAMSARTKAIIPVHLFGHPADLDSLAEVAGSGRAVIIEDVAQAFGAVWRNRRVGTFGRVSAFSFFPTKNLGAFGDGGLVGTNDADVARLARMLRAHGAQRKYANEMLGYNSRLDAVQAAVLRLKLPRVDRWNQARREAADRYRDLLSGVAGLVHPAEPVGGTHVFHQYTLRILGGRRDAVRVRLANEAIDSMIYYPTPLHLMPMFRREPSLRLPEAERAAAEVLSLPLWPSIDPSVQERVARVVRLALDAG